MSKEEFRELHFCSFAMPYVDIELRNRLATYYQRTSNSVSNKQAGALYREFIGWAKSCGYTQEEINRAKRDVDQIIKQANRIGERA